MAFGRGFAQMAAYRNRPALCFRITNRLVLLAAARVEIERLRIHGRALEFAQRQRDGTARGADSWW